ncbi:MAG: hypothetical protein N7Q72_01510 [Spiroplasma sp. Tabriz.8]|nr:hypothetical protein [Spiroplasma sp. Tabriz.8]
MKLVYHLVNNPCWNMCQQHNTSIDVCEREREREREREANASLSSLQNLSS